MTITNPDEAAGHYRYPDLTAQVEYLMHVVDQTINTELVSEILFIRNYDAARSAIREVVDLPDRKLDKLIQLLHQAGLMKYPGWLHALTGPNPATILDLHRIFRLCMQRFA